MNLAKFRKIQSELEDSSARAELAENQLGKLRNQSRSSVSVARNSEVREVRESTKTSRQGSVARGGSVLPR